MNTLVVLESSRGVLHRLSKEAIVAAQGMGGKVSAIILGKDADTVVSGLANIKLEEILIVKNNFVDSYDADGNGALSYDEFTKVLLSRKPLRSKRQFLGTNSCIG